MNAKHRMIAAGVSSLTLAGGAVLGLAVPAAVADDLIAVEPGQVTVEVPAPGHTDTWEMTARNVTESTVPLSLAISGAAGTVFEGTHPLDVTVSGPDGEGILDGSQIAAALAGGAGSVVALPDLAPGAEYAVRGVAAMPAEAGDEYRNASGDLTFRFVATQEGSENPGLTPPTTPAPDVAFPDRMLAWTGANPTAAVALAAALIIGGATSVVSARRRKST